MHEFVTQKREFSASADTNDIRRRRQKKKKKKQNTHTMGTGERGKVGNGDGRKR